MELSFSSLALCGFYSVSCFKNQPAIAGNAEFKKKKKKWEGGEKKLIKRFYSLVNMINPTQQDWTKENSLTS